MNKDRFLTKLYSAIWLVLAAIGYAIGMMKKFGILDESVSWLLSDAVFIHLVVPFFAFILTPLLFVISHYAKKAGMTKYCKVLRIARAFFLVWSILAMILLCAMSLFTNQSL